MYTIRYKIILVIFFLFFTGIVARLFQIQIIDSEKYQGISKTRRIRTKPLEAVRGTVFDRHGKVLAIDRHTFDISVQYRNLLYGYISKSKNTLSRIKDIKEHKMTDKSCDECHEDQKEWLKKVSQLLNIPQNQLLKNAKHSIDKVEKIKQSMKERYGKDIRIMEERKFYPIATDVPLEKVLQIEIEQEKYSGTQVTPRSKRIYPRGKLASHILGYMSKISEEEWEYYSEKWNDFVLSSVNISTGTDTSALLYDGYAKDDYIGRAGIESQYENELKGMRGKRFEEVICKNTQVEKVVLERPPIQGKNVYLTIDAQIQEYAEKALGEKVGVILIMDPWNGEILAMANSPRFNSNSFNEDFSRLMKHPKKPILNRAIQGALPPGSTFKIITTIAALSEKSINTETQIDCNGYSRYKNLVFKCWNTYGHGPVTIKDAIPYSCNVFFYELAKKTRGNPIYSWAKKLGFGEKTGIDLPHEKSGNLPVSERTAQAMNLAIGQGALLTTPIQMVRVYAAIANGGILVQPHVMLKITNNNDQTIRTFQSENTERISLQYSILETLKTALKDVVTRGTAKNKGLEVYKVAGKTGTAETGRKGLNHAWFIGYVPYDKPKYCFVILRENTAEHSGTVTGPIARALLSLLFPELAQTS